MPGYVLTGTPGAGKTAMLRLLESHGHVVVEEAATDVIALQRALADELPWNGSEFIDKIVTLQRMREAGARAVGSEVVFFDRSPVCTLALSRYAGLAPSGLLTEEVDRVIADAVYEQTVFFVRNLGFVQPTAARRISFDDALRFERIHEETYRELGFRLVEVPAGPLLDRVDLVQQTVRPLTSDYG
jgi:predicted ATPase